MAGPAFKKPALIRYTAGTKSSWIGAAFAGVTVQNQFLYSWSQFVGRQIYQHGFAPEAAGTPDCYGGCLMSDNQWSGLRQDCQNRHKPYFQQFSGLEQFRT